MKRNSIRAACAAAAFAVYAFASINPAAAMNAAECSVSGGTWSQLGTSATSGFCLQTSANSDEMTAQVIQVSAEKSSGRNAQTMANPGSGRQERQKHHRRSIYTGTGCPPACKR